MSFPHHDLPMYREAVAVTQNATGFAPRLIEKDYFCSIVLQALFGVPSRLAILRRQLDSELKPVLRSDDFAAFDLDRAYALVRGVVRLLH